jgi:transposase
MLMLPSAVRIWLAAEPVDMRCGHDGLMAVVKNRWLVDPFCGHLFVFLGKRRDRCKILFWARGGFVLYYKRLERGCFAPPKLRDGELSVHMDSTELAMLLDGIELQRVRRPTLWEPKHTLTHERGSTSAPKTDPTLLCQSLATRPTS